MAPGGKNVFNFISLDLFGREEKRSRKEMRAGLVTSFIMHFMSSICFNQTSIRSISVTILQSKKERKRDMGKERRSSLPTQSLRHYPNRKKKKKKKTPSP